MPEDNLPVQPVIHRWVYDQKSMGKKSTKNKLRRQEAFASSLPPAPRDPWHEKIRRKRDAVMRHWLWWLVIGPTLFLLAVFADWRSVFSSSPPTSTAAITSGKSEAPSAPPPVAPPQTTPKEERLGITASARLPKRPHLAPSHFVIHNGPYELTAVDKLCHWPLIETTHRGTYKNIGTSDSGPRIEGVAPKAQFPVECAAPAVFDEEWKITSAIIAIDLEFGVTGRVGRYFARFEFKLDSDRELNWIWTLTSAKSGPMSARAEQ
jgi:hypothetical protein